MPLAWSEVNERLEIRSYDIRTVPQRLRRRRRDPWEGLLEAMPDLGQALSRLEERLR
jgi:bifunctional non-homologous end joining protein LigD